MNLKIASNLSLPIEAALWTFADLAIKGAGKTYAACILAEEMVKAGIPIVAIDSLGIWWGLRVGVEKHEGLPVVVFGGKHKDISIPTTMAKGQRLIIDEERLKLMVKAMLESRMSAVIDTSEFSKGMRRRIVAIFASELYNLNSDYGTRHVFLEEADEWIPQRLHGKDEWASACFGAIDDLVRKGGNFNLGCTLISQRSAVLSKDVLTQINCLIVLRILHKLDKQAVQTWVEWMARPDDKRIAKWYDTLRDLKNGEAWLWHPLEPEIFERIQFRKRETLHATREYFQQARFEQKAIRMMDVGEFISKFKNVFEPKPKEQPKPQKVVEIKPIFKDVPLQKDEKIIKHDAKIGNTIGNTTYRYEHRVLKDETEPRPLEKIHLTEHQLVLEVESHERIVRADDSTEKGMVIKVLSKAARPLSQVEIIQEAAEYGKYITAPSLSKHMSSYISEGVIVPEGRQYRLPRFVRFDIKES